MVEQPRSTRPTIADVARVAKVSATTVSHALSGSGRVNEQTRQRVRDAADELGYRPSPRATALRRGTSSSLAIASSMHTAVAGGAAHQGFYLELAGAAAERAFEHQHALVLIPPVEDGRLETISSMSVDGVLVVEPAGDDPIVHRLRRDGVPFVSIGRFPDAQPDDLVVPLGTDLVAELLIGHLADQGCRRPALLIGERSRTSYAAAEAAYLSAAAVHGWEPIVRRVTESDGAEGGYRATRELLAEDEGVDAVAAWVDAFAAGAVCAATDAGRRPPQVRVVTRYDGPRARASQPAITAVELHLPDAARAAVDLLLARLHGGEVTLEPLPPPALVTRGSSTGGHQEHA